MSGLSRRSLLQSGGGIVAIALAGCMNETAGESDELLATASFFVLADFAAHVADDSTAIENLIPVGQHGHGWEPGPNIQQAVLGAGAFIYMGKGFQPWADNIVQNLERDAPELVVIEARRGIALLDAGGHEHEAGDEHGESGTDPHFWLDPQRAAQAVETIAAGFGVADAAQAETYREGAAAYTTALAELDAAYEDALASRTRDTILVAGHDAFQYLADRYGFTVHALSALSPDTEPTPQDVRRAQELIEEYGIEHVLAPVFESDRAARQLVEETDAIDVLPITSIPTTTTEWDEQGWGYIDIMREVNLPTLREALGA